MTSAHIYNSFRWLLQKTDAQRRILKAETLLTDVQSSWNGCVLAGVLSSNFWCFLPVLDHHTRMRKLHVAENEVLQVANRPSNLWQDGIDERNPPISVAMLVLLTWSWPESIENPSISWTTPLGSQKKICIVAVSQYAIRIQLYIYIQMRYCIHLIVTNRREHLSGDIFSIYLWKWNLASIYPMKQNVSLAIATGHVGL